MQAGILPLSHTKSGALCAEVRGQFQVSSLKLFFNKQGLLLNPELAVLVRPVGPGNHQDPFPTTVRLQVSGFYVSGEDLNSGPPACKNKDLTLSYLSSAPLPTF